MPPVFPDLNTLPAPPVARLCCTGAVGTDPGDNRLIHGDNLAALAVLAREAPGSVQCIYIDPPYNRGANHRHYIDARSRADWLAFMAQRLVWMRTLLRDSGSLFVQLDDNELDYLKVLLDDIFGPDALVSRITVRARAPSAFSTVNRGVFKASEYILWYARDRASLVEYPVRLPRSPDPAYTRWIDNPDAPPSDWTLSTVRQAWRRHTSRPFRRADPQVQRFIVDHARQVFRLAPISDGKAGASTVAMKRRSRDQPDRVFVLERGGGRDPVFLLGGQQICRYDRNVQVLHGKPTATRPLTNIWTDIAWEGIAAEGGARFKQGKKPERLIQRVLELVTQPGDSVLDAFGGSGTTAAVAHKMGRAWTLIERGEQAHSIALPRIRRVVEGADRSGITEEVGWTGGGGCSVYAVEEQPA